MNIVLSEQSSKILTFVSKLLTLFGSKPSSFSYDNQFDNLQFGSISGKSFS